MLAYIIMQTELDGFALKLNISKSTVIGTHSKSTVNVTHTIIISKLQFQTKMF